MNLRDAAAQVVQAYDAHEPLAVVMEDLRTALAEPEHEIIARMRRLRAEAQAEHRRALEQGKCPSCMQPLPEELKTVYQVDQDLRNAAMQRLTDVQQEMERSIASLKAARQKELKLEEQVNRDLPVGCKRCANPLWAGTKCSSCGKDWSSLGVPDEAKAEIYRAQAEEEIKKNRYIKVSERTVRNTIARVKVFAREIPVNPTLLKAADEMERMLTELIELRRKP